VGFVFGEHVVLGFAGVVIFEFLAFDAGEVDGAGYY
jgi:hypothetical protein